MFLILFFLIAQINTLKPSTYQQALATIQDDPDHLALMMFIKNDSDESDKAIKLLEEHSATMMDILNIQIINCDQISKEEFHHLPACQYKESLPFAMYLIPPKDSDPTQGPIQPIQKLITNFSLPALKEGFLENSPQFWELINDEKQYEQFLNDKRLNKVLTKIANKPIWWYGITQKFRDRIDFAIVNPRLLSQDLVILKLINGQYIEQTYHGAKQYESLRAYLSVLASSQRVYKNLESSRNINSNQITNITSIQNINFDNQWILLSINNHQRLKGVISDMKGIFSAYNLIDNSGTQQLLIYPFSQKKNSITVKSQNTLELCIEMIDFLKYNVNTDSLQLLSEIKQLLTTKQIINVWFLNQKNYNKCHLLWALTFANKQEYKKIFSFHIIYDPDDQMKKQFYINKVPFITSLEINDGQVAQLDYTESFIYQNIEEYIDKLYQRYQLKNKQTQQYPENNKEFEFLCTQEQVKCIITIIDRKNQVDEDVFIKSMKTINNNKQIWIILYQDCQSIFIEKYKLQIPTLILYDANNYKYQIMKDQFNFMNIDKFIKQKKRNWKELDYQFQIEKCSIKKDDL
ncbi:unnamed protein product [Paramecium sonneborni]|uniref:Thioredoxin domain-containing protein n=1 Tax=Paramecium sonneborni TaxID=65129 RepID=A0A8S1PRS2_9CILI|nr:unnamed protein product [Paramecium sonneborni]